jgi:radical SAM protein with 4Fe4S-binding SPASM domain
MTLHASTNKEAAGRSSFALGLGLTNECNLACAFCYRDPTRSDRLDLEQVRRAVESVPLRSVNLGTGENGLHPDFAAILAYLRKKPLKLTMTSNGHSVRILADEDLRAFHELEFSIDYPNEAEQDAQRGAGNWALVHEQAGRCRALGLPVTFIAVMMRSNFDRLADIAAIAGEYDAPLRLNVYQAVRSDRFGLSYEQYWTGFQLLFDRTDVLAIGEPLVRAMAGLPPRRGGCGIGTIRVTPRATVKPCVYWPGQGAPLDVLLDLGGEILTEDAFVDARSVPKACSTCDYLPSCRGGCAGRRRLLDQLDQPDPYCPIIRGERRPLRITLAEGRTLAKSDSACTTVVMARSS